MTTGAIVLLGSGETAPGMTKVHRAQLTRLHEVHAVNLDTAYGFQENVPQMTEKLVDYFSTSLHTILVPLHLTSYDGSSALERTLFKQQVRAANFVFAGPGSPSYALKQWRPLNLEDDLEDVLHHDGTVCFASAAALTLGAYTAPIYEIYKVGVTPYWLEGLNLTAAIGLNCVVIPHFDNNEGGNYDTRFCYLGERRLVRLEQELPEGVATLGIDEHTALVINLKDDTMQVTGRSNCYWRLHGNVRVLENGTTTDLSELRSLEPRRSRTVHAVGVDRRHGPVELGHVAANGGDEGMAALAQLVQMASTGGKDFIDPTTLVEEILKTRRAARADGHYEIADRLRDALAKAGITVNDGPVSSTWTLTGTS